MTPAPSLGGSGRRGQGPLSQNASIPGAAGVQVGRRVPANGETLGMAFCSQSSTGLRDVQSCPPPVMGGPTRASPPGPSRHPDASFAGALVPCRKHGDSLSPEGHLEGIGLWLRARGQAADPLPSHTRRGASRQRHTRQLRDEQP